MLCGSIDMLGIRYADNAVCGWEHKSAKTFRPETYIRMDEQPRLYYEELSMIVDKMNAELPEGSKPYIVGEIFLGEAKKLLTKFEYNRVECKYSEAQRERFMLSIVKSVYKIQMAAGGCGGDDAQPGYMKCNMCDFKTICNELGYEDPELEQILGEFEEEYEVRSSDHLDEKMERHAD
jgi:hypothetical protein